VHQTVLHLLAQRSSAATTASEGERRYESDGEITQIILKKRLVVVGLTRLVRHCATIQ
jgi:hypothetical protein